MTALEDLVRAAIKLRYRPLPYLYTAVSRAAATAKAISTAASAARRHGNTAGPEASPW